MARHHKGADRRLTAALRTPTGLLSAMLVALLTVLAIVGPIIWGDEARTHEVADLLQGSTPEHLLGTDNLGRDMLARILVATRLSLLLAVLAVGVAAVIGIPLGALPSLLGPRASRAVASFIEFSLAFPALLLVIFLGVILGVGALGAVLAIGIASAPPFARLTQTLAAGIAGSDYIAAARLLGVSPGRILVRHVLPNIAEPLILNATLAIGYALLTFSGLSFLGLGVQAPAYDWGRLLDESLDRIYVTPEVALGPATAIVVAGLAFNGLGEALAAAASTRPATVRRTQPRPEPATPEIPDRDSTVLTVEDLQVTFPTASGPVTAVRGVSFQVSKGEIVGLVGESGSGKSQTALAIAQLVPHPGQVTASRLTIQGADVRRATTRRRLLGRSLAMVFQDPTTSLNPSLRIGRQLAEVGEVHASQGRRAALARALEALRKVRISSPARRLHQYPHELSGGMRQRAMVGMALMVDRDLIIADEPTSALDVTVQQQLLRLLRTVRDDTGAGMVFISHDMAVVTQLCDRVLVMYAGRIVEEIAADRLISSSAHPYTRALLDAVPHMATDTGRRLATIPGQPPDLTDEQTGCAFAPRCAFATDRCRSERPELAAVRDDERRVACWHPVNPAPAATPAHEQVAT